MKVRYFIRKTFNQTNHKKIQTALLVVYLILFKINAAFPQNVNFSANALKSLGLVYQTETDFELERRIDQAFRVDIGASSSNLLLNARLVSTLNQSFYHLSENMYSIQLNQTDYSSLGGNYSKRFSLDFSEQTILMRTPERGRGRWGQSSSNNYFIYDIIVNPVGFDYDPGQYYYSIIFTLTAE